MFCSVNGFDMQDEISKAANNNTLTIKKLDLARSVQNNTELSKTDSSKIIDQMFALITDRLASGQNVKLSNFGTFQLIDKAERTGRNPRTNEEVLIAPRRIVSFKPSSKFKQRVIKANAKDNTRKANQPLNQLTDQKKMY